MQDSRLRSAIIGMGFIFFGVLYCVSLFPQLTSAVQMESDAECVPVKQECGCMKIMKKGKCVAGNNKFMCPCEDTTSGFVTSGKCLANFKCKGESTGGMPPMLPMLPMPMPKTPTETTPNCNQPMATTTATTTDSTATSTDARKAQGATDPNCANFGFDSGFGGAFDYSAYFDAGSSDSGADSSLFDSLYSSGGGISDFLASSTAKNNAGGSEKTRIVPTTTGKLISGLFGDIRLGNAGATIIANLRDGATEVAGFFGGNSLGVIGAQSIAGRLCAVRPWASGLVSNIIKPSFFDGLCRFAGYQVGTITPQNVIPFNSQKKKTNKQPGTLPSVNISGEAEVKIWAEPPAVRLGTRTYIFWKSQGVVDCKVSGPNFSHNTFSGGASTVPISGATTYSIECTVPDGTKVSDHVTVELAI